MQIIDIRQNGLGGVVEMCRARLESEHGIEVTVLQPSMFSFITSTRLAGALKKTHARVVLVDRVRDAMAAVSARKLLDKNAAHVAVVYAATAQGGMPTGVPTEVCQGIDLWVFDDESTLHQYSENEFIEVRNSKVVHPTSLLVKENRTRSGQTDGAERQDGEVVRVSVVGELSDGERLVQSVRAVAKCATQVELHVYGTGKPRTVMPIVNEARHTEHLSVVWHGSEYDIMKVAAETDLAVQATAVPDSADIFFRSLGIAVVAPDEIAETIASASKLQECARSSKDDYERLYSPDVYVNAWRNLLVDL